MMRRSLAVPIAFLTLLVACADAPVGTGDGNDAGIEHGTGRDDVLVRVAWEGGFVPVESTYTSLPLFTLYGDGTLITPGAQIEIYPPPALPAISSRSVTEEGVQAILHRVLEATDDLPAALGDMGSMMIADAPTTVFTVSAGAEERTVRAYALAELPERPDGMPEHVFRARERLQRLLMQLTALDAWLPAGSLDDERPYRGSAARLLVGDAHEVGDLPQEERLWPLDAPLARFGEPAAAGMRCGTVSGDEWTTLEDAAARANELTPWVDGGRSYSIRFRPLLPDEEGCPGSGAASA